MKLIAILLVLSIHLVPSATAQNASTGASDATIALIQADQLPLLEGEFSAEYTISDRGRLYIWDYHAEVKITETSYFGKVPTMIAAVQDPVLLRVHHLNLLNDEIVIVTTPSPADNPSGTNYVHPTDPDYIDGLIAIKSIMARMIELDQRNAPLTAAVQYLDRKIATYKK